MAGRKRKLTGAAQASRRVIRKLEQAQGDAPPQHQDASTPTYSSDARSYLDKMPAEILLDIFTYCREPCMIHTCSRLHQVLPSFVGWTRRLAGMALIATPTSNDDLEWSLADTFEDDPLITVANRCYALPGLQAPLPEELRDALQKEVVQSKWFTLKHFEMIYSEIFKGLMYTFFYEANRFQLSSGQMRRVRKFCSGIDGFDGFENMVDFRLRIRTQIGNLSIEIGRNKIQLLQRDMLLNDCSIIRMGLIPDCVFDGAYSAGTRLTALRLVAGASPAKTIPGRDYYHAGMQLDCSHTALAKAMHFSIARCCTGSISVEDMYEYSYFQSLNEFNWKIIIGDRRPSVVNLGMLRAATNGWDPSCFEEMMATLGQTTEAESGISTQRLTELLKELQGAVLGDQGSAGAVVALSEAIQSRKHVEDYKKRSREREEQRKRRWEQRIIEIQQMADRTGQVLQDPFGTTFTPANQASTSAL